MKSTGEVMGIDDTFAKAFAKAQLGAGVKLPTKGKVFISVKDTDKQHLVQIALNLVYSRLPDPCYTRYGSLSEGEGRSGADGEQGS